LLEYKGNTPEPDRTSIESSLSLAIEEAAKDFFNSPSVIVNLDDKKLTVFYDVGVDILLKEAEQHDPNIQNGYPLHITYDFESFPKQLVNQVRDYFQIFLVEGGEDRLYRKWKRSVRHVVRGQIIDKTNQCVHVQLLDGTMGLMQKQHWVPREREHYYQFSDLFFFILKVTKNPLIIHLSRASKSLPELLMKLEMPWGNFRCEKRFIGQKSIMRTNLERSSQLIEAAKSVRSKLCGELIEVRSIL